LSYSGLSLKLNVFVPPHGVKVAREIILKISRVLNIYVDTENPSPIV
jgi:hypothetical protein